MIPPRLCLSCKGSKYLCGHRPCPLTAKFYIKPRIAPKLKEEFFGPGTSVFVGHNFYPNVCVGPMAALQDKSSLESSSDWFGMKYQELIGLRSSLLRGKATYNVYSKAKFIEENQLLALAKKPVDIELNFKNKPIFDISFSNITPPAGPSATLKKMNITQNVRISRRVDAIVSDDLKANQASYMLYDAGQDVYKITTILSSGALGYKQKQKLVPTRWSITAVDDLICKQLLQDVRNFSVINDYWVFESGYLGNHFIILLEPGNWEFENFEAWAPNTPWAIGAAQTAILEEYEPYHGRAKYADKQAGGYYAARIGIVEFLHKIKRQARVISFREISEGYIIPLGVWIVRETVRNAFQKRPRIFQTRKQALRYINSKLTLSIKDYQRESNILKQRKLSEFL